MGEDSGPPPQSGVEKNVLGILKLGSVLIGVAFVLMETAGDLLFKESEFGPFFNLLVGVAALIVQSFFYSVVLRKEVFLRLARLASSVKRSARLAKSEESVVLKLRDRLGVEISQAKDGRDEPPSKSVQAELLRHDDISQIALVLDRTQKQSKKYQQIFVDLFEVTPCPLVAFAEDGRIFHVNKLFCSFYGLDAEDLREWGDKSFDKIVCDHLGATHEFCSRLQQILSYSAPRICDKEFEFQIAGMSRVMKVSASTFVFESKRILVVSLNQDQSAVVALSNTKEMLSELAFRQIKALRTIMALAEHSAEGTQRTIQIECEKLIDNINVLFDIANSTGSDVMHSNIEFNLISFLHELSEKLKTLYPLEVAIPDEGPFHVAGDPTHLRHCLLVFAEAFYDVNPQQKLRISMGEFSRDAFEVRLEGAENDVPVNSFQNVSLAEKLSNFFRFQMLPVENSKTNAYARFVFPVVKSNFRIENIFLNTVERLSKRNILCLHTGHELSFDVANIFQSLSVSSLRIQPHSHYKTLLQSEETLDAVVVVAQDPLWSKDADLQNLVRMANKLGISVGVLPLFPRRGDSVSAQETGFAAYLPSPLDSAEVEELLMLLSDKKTMHSFKGRGLITRYTLQELSCKNRRALLVEFNDDDRKNAELCAGNLQQFGFKVTRVRGAGDFFEQLAASADLDFIFMPNHVASSGLRRRLSMIARRHKFILYNTGTKEAESEVSHRPFVVHCLENPGDHMEMLRVLQAVAEAASPFARTPHRRLTPAA